MRVGPRLVAPLALAALVACGLDVIGTYGASGGVTAADAGGDASPGGADEGGASSVLPLVEAGTNADAATALDASPSPGFCAGQTTPFVYCNDFEMLVVGFARQRATGGSIVVDDPDGTGNHALRVKVDDGEETRNVYVTEPLTRLPEMAENGYDITYAFSVRSSSLGFAVLGGPHLTDDPGTTGGEALGLAVYDDGVRLDYARSGDLPSIYWLPGPTWHSAWIRHGKAPFGGDPFVQVVVDGVVVALDRVKKEDDFGALVLRLGGYATSKDKGGLDVLFDDVLVRTF